MTGPYSSVVDDACPNAGVIAEFPRRWNQLGIGPSSPAGHGEECFFDFGLGEIADLLEVAVTPLYVDLASIAQETS
jgi:hypothetical protein